MVILAKLWYYLKKVPTGLWWLISVFFGGVILACKVMGTKQKIRDVEAEAKRDLDIIEQHREELREAVDSAKDGDTEVLREQVLRNIKEEK